MESPAPKQNPYLLFLLPAFIILLFLTTIPVIRGIFTMHYPYQLDYAEGFLAVEAQFIAQGKNIYAPLNNYPYLVGNYPPLFPLLNAPFFLAFGPGLVFGRALCVLSALGICALMFFIVRKRTHQPFLAILSPLLFLNTYALFEWIGYARVDLPAILFSLAGLAVLAGDINPRRLNWALVFFLLSIYTKQIQIFAPLSACIYLIIKDRKMGLRFTLRLFEFAAGIFIILTLITRGEYFNHTVLYNANVFDWWQVKVWLRHLMHFYALYVFAVLILGAVAIHLFFAKQKCGDSAPPDLFSIYAILGALSFFTIGKVGAASNYLLEFHIALGIFFCLQISRLANFSVPAFKRTIPIAFLIIITLLINFHAIRLAVLSHQLFSRPNPTPTAYLKGNLLFEIVRQRPDPILCEEPIFLLLAGKEVVFQPFIMSQLAKEKKWGETRFIADLRKKRFSLIVTGQDVTKKGKFFWQYTKAMCDAIRENYMLLFTTEPKVRSLLESPAGGIPYFIYIPKSNGSWRDDFQRIIRLLPQAK